MPMVRVPVFAVFVFKTYEYTKRVAVDRSFALVPMKASTRRRSCTVEYKGLGWVISRDKCHRF